MAMSKMPMKIIRPNAIGEIVETNALIDKPNAAVIPPTKIMNERTPASTISPERRVKLSLFAISGRFEI